MRLAINRAWFTRHQRVVVGLTLVVIAGIVIIIPTPGHQELINSYTSCARAGYMVSDTNPPVCHGPQTAYVGPTDAPRASAPALVSQPFTLLVDGDLNNTVAKQSLVISTQADWGRYWREVHAGISPLPPIIPVDFSKNDVLAVNLGQQQTLGYNIKITAIFASPLGSTVSVIEQIPTIACHPENHTSNRYVIVSTAKLPPPVSFRSSADPRQCTF